MPTFKQQVQTVDFSHDTLLYGTTHATVHRQVLSNLLECQTA